MREIGPASAWLTCYTACIVWL